MKRWGIGFSLSAIAWMGLIFYLSGVTESAVLSGTAPGSQAVSSVVSSETFNEALEKALFVTAGDYRSLMAHVFFFGTLSVLIQAALWGWGLGIRARMVIVATVTASLFALSDEYHQSFVPGRAASMEDFWADSIAAAASATLMWAIAISKLRRRWS